MEPIASPADQEKGILPPFNIAANNLPPLLNPLNVAAMNVNDFYFKFFIVFVFFFIIVSNDDE